MSARLDVEKKPRSLIHIISGWWQAWTRNISTSSELSWCTEGEVERISRDMGLPAQELRRLAQYGPDAADLLLRRMVALHIDQNEVFQTEPGTFRDLQRVCTLCESRRRCARDLARDSTDPVWEDYCPNIATLKMLNAMPWAADCLRTRGSSGAI